MRHIDELFKMNAPSFYVCTGDEDEGLQEAFVNGQTFYFYLSNIHAGALIKYENGHFYTNDSTMILTAPTHTDEETLPPAQTENTQTVPGRGQGGTEQGGDYYASIPEELQGQTVETLATYEADGTPHYYVKQNDVWIEIPLISAEEVEMVNGTLALKMINVSQDGDTVEVS